LPTRSRELFAHRKTKLQERREERRYGGDNGGKDCVGH
jgi:hypothetical protein